MTADDGTIRTIRLSDQQNTDVYLRRRTDAKGGYDIALSRLGVRIDGDTRGEVEAWAPNVAERIGIALIELAREARQGELAEALDEIDAVKDRMKQAIVLLNSDAAKLQAEQGTNAPYPNGMRRALFYAAQAVEGTRGLPEWLPRWKS